MFTIIYGHVIVFMLILQSLSAQRRIIDGKDVQSDKRYVVYLIKASNLGARYDTWLCGGALVSPVFIITSAACVEDVHHMYAIAGYKKYVTYELVEVDVCTKKTKKKIVYICVPKTYDFEYDRLEKWAFNDIAVVKVESPYDFNTENFAPCSYAPSAIPVNYEHKYQEPGIDAVVFGWGHTRIWRDTSDSADYNSPQLRYGSTLIHDKEDCMKSYAHYPKLSIAIEKYMICSSGIGNLNDAGKQIMRRPAGLKDGCVTAVERTSGMVGLPCLEINSTEIIDETVQRRSIDANHTNEYTNTRRNGICQNDHGGPLVTWVGSHEVLIGVASVFKVNNRSECEGPYLYTSTQCNGAFLDCILNMEKPERRSFCHSAPEEKGFDMLERDISWSDHPDGPADNEQSNSTDSQSSRAKNDENRTVVELLPGIMKYF